jgi:hypothetical protein
VYGPSAAEETYLNIPRNKHPRLFCFKNNSRYYVGFEALTAVVMESTIFSDITPCSPLSVNRCFGETCASIFMVEKLAEQETSVKASGKQILFVIYLCLLIKLDKH